MLKTGVSTISRRCHIEKQNICMASKFSVPAFCLQSCGFAIFCHCTGSCVLPCPFEDIRNGSYFLGLTYPQDVEGMIMEMFYKKRIYASPFCRDYYQSRLALEWREWMTEHFTNLYLQNRTFYQVQAGSLLDNPDQRISSDVR